MEFFVNKFMLTLFYAAYIRVKIASTTSNFIMIHNLSFPITVQDRSNYQSKTPSRLRRKSTNSIMKENRQIVRKSRKHDFTMNDLNDDAEEVEEFKSKAKPIEKRKSLPKRRSKENIQYIVSRNLQKVQV